VLYCTHLPPQNNKMADPMAPKLDFKMLVVPAVLFFGKSIDFKNPEIADMLRNIFISGMTYDI
jgi:hypothetical protein